MEFCSVDAMSQVLHTRPSKILPRHTNGPRTVHVTPNQNHPTINHQQIQFERHCERWVGVRPNRQGHVRFTGSRRNSQQPAQKTLG